MIALCRLADVTAERTYSGEGDSGFSSSSRIMFIACATVAGFVDVLMFADRVCNPDGRSSSSSSRARIEIVKSN